METFLCVFFSGKTTEKWSIMVDIKVDKQQPLKIDSYFNYFNVALFIYSKNLILYFLTGR